MALENRLPAAIEDGFEDDFDRVSVFGDSFGDNIAHHLVMKLGHGSPKVKPIIVHSYILLSSSMG